MPTPHDDLLTPTELEAAQLMSPLAWLDGGQLVSADQMLRGTGARPGADAGYGTTPGNRYAWASTRRPTRQARAMEWKNT